VPRQLGYKSVKFLTGLMVTDSAKGFARLSTSSPLNYGCLVMRQISPN
jgi:hypothetical protein